MFDLKVLAQDTTIEKVIPVDCLKVEDGEDVPEITININDKIRKKERELSKRYSRFIISNSGSGTHRKQEGYVKSDKLSYCLELSDVCVVGSSCLFAEGGKPAEHSRDGFRALLSRYPQFLGWFSDAITTAFVDTEAFRQAEDEAIDLD